MPTPTRETILDALMAHLKARCGTTFKTYSRRFVDWERLVGMIGSQDPGVPAFPALYMYDGGLRAENWTRTHQGLPPSRTLTRHLVIYARLAGAGTPGGPDRSLVAPPAGAVLNPLIEAVEAALTPGGPVKPDNVADGTISLGGLVNWARLDGEGDTIPGDLDESGLMMQTMPVKITIP